MTLSYNLQHDLKSGKKKIGVWGLGYIGFSSIAHFAKAGVTCIGTDPYQVRVDDVNQGKATIPNLDFWLGFDTKPLAKDKRMSATTSWQELINPEVAVHLISVPTEMDGKPHHNILIDVINKISSCKGLGLEHPPLVIVESTLTPTVADNVVFPLFKKNGLEVGKDILFGVAPRRDWFTAADKGLALLPRVVGGTTKETTELMAQTLGIICRNIINAQDHKHAAIVKSIENAYRHLDIAFANQLSLAYPDMDMNAILQMVGTKWNVNTYHASFGTGGYCLDGKEWIVLKDRSGQVQVKQLQDLSSHDTEILSYHPQSRSAQFKRITNRSRRTSETITLTLTGNHKITVTPDHVMYVKKKRLHQILAGKIKVGEELPFLRSLPAVSNLWKKYPYFFYHNERPYGLYINLQLLAQEKGLLFKLGNKAGRILKTGMGRSHQQLPYALPLNERFAELLGLYASEGCVTRDVKSLRTYLTLHQEEKEIILFITDLFTEFGIPYFAYADKKTKAYQIRVSGSIWGSFIREFCGANAYTAKIHPVILFHPNKKIRLSVLKGLLNGDGSFSPKSGVIEFYTVSPLLHQQVLLLARSLGLQPILKLNHSQSGIPLIRFAGEYARTIARGLFRDKKLLNVEAYAASAAFKNQKMRRTDNRKIVVKSIRRNKEQTVYGLDVADNHNYVTSGGLIVHNCIPLAPQYVLEGAKHPEKLTLLQEALKTDFSQPDTVVESLLRRKVQKVALLGIAYTGDLKVHVLSPALPIARKLKEKGVEVKVHDPYYTEEEIGRLTGCESLAFPEGLRDCDCVLLVSPHMHYKYVHKQELMQHLQQSPKLILDNMGVWNDLHFPEGIEYYEVGHAHWLGKA